MPADDTQFANAFALRQTECVLYNTRNSPYNSRLDRAAKMYGEQHYPQFPPATKIKPDTTRGQ